MDKSFRLAKAAAIIGIAGSAATFGVATASATTSDDERFVGIVANLDIQLSPQQAIQTGHEVCDGVAAGVQQGADPADIRGSLVNGLMGQGFDNSQAANFFWAAVDVYCPQYNDVAGD